MDSAGTIAMPGTRIPATSICVDGSLVPAHKSISSSAKASSPTGGDHQAICSPSLRGNPDTGHREWVWSFMTGIKKEYKSLKPKTHRADTVAVQRYYKGPYGSVGSEGGAWVCAKKAKEKEMRALNVKVTRRLYKSIPDQKSRQFRSTEKPPGTCSNPFSEGWG